MNKLLAFVVLLLVSLSPLYSQSLTERSDSGWVDSMGIKASYPPRQRSVVYKNDTGKSVIATIVHQSMTDAQKGVTEESSEERTVAAGGTLTLNSWERWDSVVTNEMLWDYSTLDAVRYEDKPILKQDQTVIIMPSSITITAGDSVKFTAKGGADDGYVWDDSGLVTGSSKTIAFNTVGSFSVTVQHPGNDDYYPSNTAPATVTVVAAPTASISVSPANASVASGGTASTTVSWSTSGATSVSVSGPSGFSSSATSGSAASASFGVGSYTFTVTATNAAGKSVSQSATFTVTESGKANQTVTISPSTSSITAGQSVSFTAMGGVDSGYSWGGAASGTGASQTVAFPNAGTYSVSVYHPGNASANPSAPAIASVTVSAGDSGADNGGDHIVTIDPAAVTVDEYQSENFRAVGGKGTGTYVWSGYRAEQVGSSTSDSASFYWKNAGSYSISVRRNGDGNYSASNTATAAVTVKKASEPSAPEMRVIAIPSSTPAGSVVELSVAVTTTEEAGVMEPSYYQRIAWTVPEGWSVPAFDRLSRGNKYQTVFFYKVATPSQLGTFSLTASLNTMGMDVSASAQVTTYLAKPEVSAQWVYPDGASSYPYYVKQVAVDVTASSPLENIKSISFLSKAVACDAMTVTERLAYDYNFLTWHANFRSGYTIRATSASGLFTEIYAPPSWDKPQWTLSVAFDKPYYLVGEIARATVTCTDQYGNDMLSSALTAHMKPAVTVTYGNEYIEQTDEWGTYYDIDYVTSAPGDSIYINQFHLDNGKLEVAVEAALNYYSADTGQIATINPGSIYGSVPVLAREAPSIGLGASPSKVTAPGTINLLYTTTNVAEPVISGPGFSQSVVSNRTMYPCPVSYDADTPGGTYTYTLSGKDWQGNTVSTSATVTVTGGALRTTLQPLASDYTVADSASPMNGRTYKRLWQEGAGWSAYLGRTGVRFKVSGSSDKAVDGAELQALEPSGVWTTLASAGVSGTAGTPLEQTFSVRLGEMSPDNALAPLSYAQGAPKIGTWSFRARFKGADGSFGAWSSEVPVSVVLPIATVSETLQTIPPAGGDGAWFKASKEKTFSLPVWIP